MRVTKQWKKELGTRLGSVLQWTRRHIARQGIAYCMEQELKSGQSAFVPKCTISGGRVLYMFDDGS